MEKKKIYLHIGHGKTGTSSLQKFLLKESLKKNCNFLYPKNTLIGDGHHELFKADERVFKSLYKEIISSSKENVIISSECGLPNFRNFVRGEAYKIDFFYDISKKFNVDVIYYVRNHFEILESSFLQYVKTKKPEVYLNFLRKNQEECFLKQKKMLKNYFFPEEIKPQLWLDTAPTRQFDYYANIECFWGKIFDKKIFTKTYNKNNLVNENIIDDFLSIVDPKNEFLINNAAKETVLENKTGAYAYNKMGFLIDEEVKQNIKNVFFQSNISYSKKYLDKINSDYLMDGFF